MSSGICRFFGGEAHIHSQKQQIFNNFAISVEKSDNFIQNNKNFFDFLLTKIVFGFTI